MRALFSLLFFAALLPASNIPTITEAGSLGGASTVAYQISDSGLIVGYAQVSNTDTHAFSATSGGGTHDLNGAASESGAYGVNSAGQIVGTSYVNGQAHGTIWSSTGVTDLGAGSYATAINSSGEVAGGNGQAFLYRNGVTEELGVLAGGNWSSAYGINSEGSVVGNGNVAGGDFRGFVWTAGLGLTELGTLGGSNSYANAINDLGQIVGDASVASGYDHAFVDSNGTLHDLGTLGGGNSYAYDINNAGVIVGYSYLAGNAVTHAFAYVNGQMIDLNSLLPLDSGWVLETAYGINNFGDIVGTGTYNGQQEAFLLDPQQFGVAAIPEPGTVGLVLLGLSVLGATLLLRRGFAVYRGGSSQNLPDISNHSPKTGPSPDAPSRCTSREAT
jgi:probable HAF family extracellular repeat protein